MSLRLVDAPTIQTPAAEVEELTTEEAIRTLFPEPVIERAKRVAGVSDARGVRFITEDASEPPTL